MPRPVPAWLSGREAHQLYKSDVLSVLGDKLPASAANEPRASMAAEPSVHEIAAGPLRRARTALFVYRIGPKSRIQLSENSDAITMG